MASGLIRLVVAVGMIAAACGAMAQAPQRVRGTIEQVDGQTL